MKDLLYLKNVVTLKLDPARCTGCGTCLDVCPRAVLARNNGKVTIATLDACIECGACQQNCPAGALSVRAGVGCAHAIINAALGRTSADCCCIVETREPDDPPFHAPSDRTTCC
jgi:NAD-dependent dihydropyrimidine dehydrogenase PreA subunit